jgi:hypothetical protein
MTQARRTWNAGDIPTANDFNNCVRDSSVYGVGAALVGTPSFGNGGGFLWQAGQVVVTTNSAGGAAFNWPTPFPNGVLSCMVMAGDSTTTQVGIVAGIWTYTTQTGWGGICATQADGNIISGAVRLNYIVIGW